MRIRFKHLLHRAGACAACVLLTLGALPNALGAPSRAHVVEGTTPPDIVESAPAEDSYFSDAVFAGDSIISDIEMLDLFPEADFVCRIGISPASARFQQFKVMNTERRDTFSEAIARCEPKKVYLLIGSNGLDIAPSAAILTDYGSMLDDIIAAVPDAVIYVISPPPMTKERFKTAGGPNPGRYRNFEKGLVEIARARGLYYIDLYHMVLDEEGNMLGVWAAGDGYHINFDGCRRLADYIRTRAVPYGAE